MHQQSKCSEIDLVMKSISKELDQTDDFKDMIQSELQYVDQDRLLKTCSISIESLIVHRLYKEYRIMHGMELFVHGVDLGLCEYCLFRNPREHIENNDACLFCYCPFQKNIPIVSGYSVLKNKSFEGWICGCGHINKMTQWECKDTNCSATMMSTGSHGFKSVKRISLNQEDI